MKTLFAFNQSEISLFNNSYFSYFSYRNHTIEIRSQNTGHWWLIQKIEMPICNKIKVWHKYDSKDKYHVQFHVHHVWKAHEMITSHDIYILNKSTQTDAICV